MLDALGADIAGLGLQPTSSDGIYRSGRVGEIIRSHIVDIRDAAAVLEVFRAERPDVVLHLAAQAIVGESYKQPYETYSTNVMGLLNVLEGARASSASTILNVTSDKCYLNREWDWPYRETDHLGGHDPYSASKACAEVVTASYRESFLRSMGIGVASARAGNVIGGGDWAPGRIVPDAVRAFFAGRPLEVRMPQAIRPWQHVFEPLGGYLLLCERLSEDNDDYAGAWNFGPDVADCRSVGEVAQLLAQGWPSKANWEHVASESPVHEAGILQLDSSKSRRGLGWEPQYTLGEAIELAISWYGAWKPGADMSEVCRQQVRAHIERTFQAGP